MISDRYYMRETNPVRALAPLLWLIGALVAGYVVQRIVDATVAGAIIPGNLRYSGADLWLALSPHAIATGKVWTLLTYSFLHDRNSLWHLIGNSLTLLLIGRVLLPAVGLHRFFWTYTAGVLAGGVFWLAVNFFHPTPPLIGASAGASAVFALFCCRFANDRMTFLLFFILPITVVPKYLLMISGAITTIFFLFAELFPVGAASGIAHSAHLAGLIAGIVAHRAMRKADTEPEPAPQPRRTVEIPAWMRKKNNVSAPAPSFKVNLTARENLKAEVDRILDKINTSGFGSLTAEEKRTLDEARNMMSNN